MESLNVSLPIKLKEEAQNLITEGYYASFSDLVRTAIRMLTAKENTQYDFWADEAEKEYRAGTAVVLKSNEEIKEYLDKILKD